MTRLEFPTLSVVFALTVSSAFGQPTKRVEHDHIAHNHAMHDRSRHEDGHLHGEEIAFQLATWKTMHFDDVTKAEAHATAVEKIGCEVKSSGHDGHFDVVYRCRDWTTVQTQTHALAEQWSSWLEKSGFDVHHGHVDERLQSGTEVVKFRLFDWKTVHANDERTIAMLRQIGAAIRISRHDGHNDVTYRCPVWTDIHLADHDEADRWMRWLEGRGFEVRHSH